MKMGRQCPQMRHKHSLDSVTWAIWAWSRLFPRDNCDKGSLVQMAFCCTTEQIQSQHFNWWLWWTKLPGEAVKTSPINCPNRWARCALLCLIGLHFPLDLHSWMCGLNDKLSIHSLDRTHTVKYCQLGRILPLWGIPWTTNLVSSHV